MSNFIETARTFNEPTIKFTPGGLAITEFGIVVERYNAKKLKEEGKQDADFIKCVCMGKTAEFVANNLGKGKYVKVEGDLQIDMVDGQNGKQYYTKVKVNQVKIIEWKDNPQSNTQPPRDKPEPQSDSGLGFGDFQAIEDDDDIPF